LVQLLTALLAFLLESLKRGDGGGHQLNDDAGTDVWHDVQRENGHAPQRTAGEHIEHTKNAAAMLRQHFAHHGGIDTGHRDIRAEAIDDQRPQRKPNTLLELGRLRKDAHIEIGCKLFGSGRHEISLCRGDRD
jgi:hypothetical protein